MFSIPEDFTAFLSRVKEGDHGAFTELEAAHSTAPAFVLFHFSGCPRCEKERYLTSKIVTVETDSEGDEQRTEESIFENLILTEEKQDAIATAWFPQLVG